MNLLPVRRRGGPSNRAENVARIDRGRTVLGLGVVLMIVVHGFWPQTFAVDGYSLALVGVLLILAIHQLLRSAKVPGLAALEFREELAAGEKAAQRV